MKDIYPHENYDTIYMPLDSKPLFALIYDIINGYRDIYGIGPTPDDILARIDRSFVDLPYLYTFLDMMIANGWLKLENRTKEIRLRIK